MEKQKITIEVGIVDGKISTEVDYHHPTDLACVDVIAGIERVIDNIQEGMASKLIRKEAKDIEASIPKIKMSDVLIKVN